MSELTLGDIPGVGSSREKMLRQSGYSSVQEVADSDPLQLTKRTELNQQQVEDIQEGAKFLCNYEDSTLATIASDYSIPEDQVLETYRSIVVYGGSFADKEAVLRKYFSNEKTLLNISGVSLHYLYLLYRAGFKDIESVATSSPDELTDATYLTHQAEEIVKKAREIFSTGSQSIQKKDTTVNHICPDCGEEFRYERKYEKHRNSHDESSTEDSTNTTNSSQQNSDANENHHCPDCGKEFKYERVYKKHRYSCNRNRADSTSSSQQSSTTAQSDIVPCPLTEYYESLKSIKIAIENLGSSVMDQDISEPQLQYYKTISSIVETGHPDPDEVPGYGSQQSTRASHSVNQYREKYGNGEWITKYPAIDTEAPNRSTVKRLNQDFSQKNPFIQKPLPPTENTAVPIIVESRTDLQRALWLLSKFPARPKLYPKDTSETGSMPVQEIYRAELEGANVDPVDLRPSNEQPSARKSATESQMAGKTISANEFRETSPRKSEDVVSPPRQEVHLEELTTTKKIGSGGQAVIKLAELPDQKAPPKTIAYREPAVSGTVQSQIVDEFLSKVRIWERIDRREREKHRWSGYENIVGVVDTGDTLPWIAIEYMDGGDLSQQITASTSGLPINQALWTGECVCKALEIAHQLGVAHLDIKPENVLLKETDGWPWPKVSDWGIARTIAEETGTMENLSIEYAAPEQFDTVRFGDPDQLTDIYQTGALMYALLTGQPPATGQSFEIINQIMSEKSFTPISEQRVEVSTTLDVAIAVALERDKTNRYDSITDFRKALSAIRTGGQLPPVVSKRLDLKNND